MLAVVALLGLGVLVGRHPRLPAGTATSLDWIVVQLSLPALVVARLPELTIDVSAAIPFGVAWGLVVVLSGLVLAVSRRAGWSRRTEGTLLLCVTLGNTSFLGIPATEALLGPDHVPFAVLFDQLGSFLALATWGTFVAARWGAGEAPSAAATVRRVVTFPPFVGLVVGLGLAMAGTTLPGVLATVADLLAATLTPLAMLAVGLRLRLPRRGSAAPLAAGLALKMLVAPALVVPLALAAGGGLAWETSALEAGMPPMVTAGVIAIGAGLDEDLTVSLVGGGILLSILTLPLLALLVV